MSRFMPDFSKVVEPEILRQCLDYTYRMLDAAKERRVEMLAEGATLSQRLVMATIQFEIEDAIKQLHRLLTRHARRGAGRSPAVMAQGCAALAPAVGPAPAAGPADITHSR